MNAEVEYKLWSVEPTSLPHAPYNTFFHLLLVPTDIFLSLLVFKRLHISREKRLLPSSCPSVHPSACVNSAPTQRFSVKFGTGDFINLLAPNDGYSGRTAPLTSKYCILYIYSTNIGTEYFKHGIYSPFFPLQNAVFFIILTYLVPFLFIFYIQGVLKFKKIIPAPKG